MTLRIDKIPRLIRRLLPPLREFGKVPRWVPVEIVGRRRMLSLRPWPSSCPWSIVMTVVAFLRRKPLQQTLTRFAEYKPTPAPDLAIALVLQDPLDAETARVVKGLPYNIVDNVFPESTHEITRGYSGFMRVASGSGADFVLHLDDEWESRSSIEPYDKESLGALGGGTDVGYGRVSAVCEPVGSHNHVTRWTISYAPRPPHVPYSDSPPRFTSAVLRADAVVRVISVDPEVGCAVRGGSLGIHTGSLMHDALRHIARQRETAWQS